MPKKALLVVTLAALLCAHGQSQSSGSPKIANALAKLDPYITDTMKKTKLPGLAVAVVYKGQVVFIKGYGCRKLGEPGKVNADTVFEIASLSKPLSSTIVASLVGTGDVSWDDRIQALEPDFQLSDPSVAAQVTIRDFFSHRTGLPTDSGDYLEDLNYSRPEILHKMRLVPFVGQFRTTYHYSNFGLTQAAIAASLKTGRTWEELAYERLYSRIGMTSTSSRYSDYQNNPNKAALHYLQNKDYKNWFVREADSEAPAGGVSSNVRDLAKWMQLQLGGGSLNGEQIVEQTALDETHKPQICKAGPGPYPPGECPNNNYYGLGWNVGHDAQGRLLLSHSGAFLLGAATTVFLLPSEQIGIVVLTNGTPIGVPESIALTFLDYYRYGAPQNEYLALFAPIFQQMYDETQDGSKDYGKLPAPGNPSHGGALSGYVGTYASPYYGKLHIELVKNQLILRLPPRSAYYELTHWDGDTFTYYFTGENTGVARRGLQFLNGGKQVLVENLAKTENDVVVNDGMFTKVE